MIHIKVKSDYIEYKVAINGFTKVDCLDCIDTGISVFTQDDTIIERVCICGSGNEDDYDRLEDFISNLI